MLLTIFACKLKPAADNAVPSTVRIDPAPRMGNSYSPTKAQQRNDWVYMAATSGEVTVVLEDRTETYRVQNGWATTRGGLQQVPGEGQWVRGLDGDLERRIIVPESDGL